MIKAGVIGHPIGHSKSPLIHGHWMERHGIAGSYRAIDIAPENLREGVAELAATGYAGFNVTVPHKIAVMDLCATLDDTARAIGAVNTVIIKDGLLHGRNTDAFGFIENLKQQAPDYRFDAPVMVLGAGGAARAAVYALIEAGVPDIRIANRSRDKAETLRALAPERIRATGWDERGDLSGISLVVNTTSLGMNDMPPLDMPLDTLARQSIVYDIVYAPLITPLLGEAQRRGHRVVTGIGMLLHQARPAFAAWTGVMPQVDEALERKVLA